MNKFQNTTPHFFQPLIPGFDSNFSIPKAFHKFLEGEKYVKDTVTLRDRKNGRSWNVKVDDKLQFKQGWNKFCIENKLQIGDFLVFRLVGNWDFEIFIFDTTCCERPSSHFSSSNYSPQVELQRDANGASGDEMLNEALGKEEVKEGQWSKVSFKPRGLPYCQLLPKDFAEENGLNKDSDIVLLDIKGRAWPMQIRLPASGAPYIGRWVDFQRAYQLKTGDSFIIELVQPGLKPVFQSYL